MGLSDRSMSLKLNGKRPWRDTEIYQAAELLDIDGKEVRRIFLHLKFMFNELLKESNYMELVQVRPINEIWVTPKEIKILFKRKNPTSLLKDYRGVCGWK